MKSCPCGGSHPRPAGARPNCSSASRRLIETCCRGAPNYQTCPTRCRPHDTSEFVANLVFSGKDLQRHVTSMQKLHLSTLMNLLSPTLSISFILRANAKKKRPCLPQGLCGSKPTMHPVLQFSLLFFKLLTSLLKPPHNP